MSLEEMTREELLELCRKLPVTADGVPVVPGMKVFVADDISDEVNEFGVYGYTVGQFGSTISVQSGGSVSAEYCYSTRAAAEARREKR